MALTDFHFIFIHGYTSSSKGDWYPCMASLLDKAQVRYSMPDLPGNDRPQASQWLKQIHNEVQRATLPVVLVGQSLGTRAAMLYLHNYPTTKVAAVFLIATFNNDVDVNKFKRGEGYANFWEFPVDIARIRDQALKWVVVHAYDDKNIHYSQAQDIAKQLGGKLLLSNGQAHFNHPSHAAYIFKVFQKQLQPSFRERIYGFIHKLNGSE